MCMQDAAWHGMNAHGPRYSLMYGTRTHIRMYKYHSMHMPPPMNHVDRAWLVARGLSVASCSSHVTEPHPCCPMQKNHVAKVIVSRFREIIWNHARKAWPHAATRFVMMQMNAT